MKYIIEIEDEPCMYECGIKFYQCKNVPYWSISDRNISKLEPYTESDRKAIEDEVWEFAQKVYEVIDDDNDIFFGHSYHEMKERYEAWLKQKDEIRVGDEVEYKGITNRVVVVTEIDNDMFDGVDADGIVYSNRSGKHWKKTGRHFPEVAELLEKMRGEDE